MAEMILARVGPNVDTFPSAAALIVRVWVVLKRRQPYVDLGEHYFDQHDEERIVRRSLRHLESCGYKVTLEKSAKFSVSANFSAPARP